MNVQIGNTVWFHDSIGVESGVVIDTIASAFSTCQVACLRCRDRFKLVDVDSRRMWLTRQEAVLALAEKKQREAADLLREAAELFKRAGGMKEEAVVAAGGEGETSEG